MNEFLAHPIWQFIGVVLALLALAASIIVYFLQRSRKVLAYLIETRAPLVSVSEEARGDIEVLYKGDKVEEVYLYQIRIFNAGNEPVKNPTIKREDPEIPLSFEFREKAVVLSAEVTRGDPSSLKEQANVEYNENRVTLGSFLLNKQDMMELRVIASHASEEVKSRGHIEGIKIVQAKNPPEMYNIKDIAKVAGVGLIIIAVMTGWAIVSGDPADWIVMIFVSLGAMIGVGIQLREWWKGLFIS